MQSGQTVKCYKGTGANGYGVIEILHYYYYYYCYYFFYNSLCWCSFCAPAGTNHAPSQSFCSNTKHLSEDLWRSQHADLLNLCHNSCLWYFLHVFHHPLPYCTTRTIIIIIVVIIIIIIIIIIITIISCSTSFNSCLL